MVSNLCAPRLSVAQGRPDFFEPEIPSEFRCSSLQAYYETYLPDLFSGDREINTTLAFMVGRQYQNWTVTGVSEERSGHVIAECKCGTSKEVRSDSLLSARSSDCGCTRRRTVSRLKSFPDALITRVMSESGTAAEVGSLLGVHKRVVERIRAKVKTMIVYKKLQSLREVANETQAA